MPTASDPVPAAAPAHGDTLEVDVVVLGGGVTGLWTLDALTTAGWQAVLVEGGALGRGQTIGSQGIIHGGGKYALRGVRDFAAVDAIREMPARWRDHLDGKRAPDLSAASVLSPSCLLWDTRHGGLLAPLRRLFLPLVARSRMLATNPERIPPERWPHLLKGRAGSVFAMAEPVLATGSVLAALATPHRARLLSCDPARTRITRPPEERALATPIAPQPIAVDIVAPATGKSLRLLARTIVLAAGAGNETLLAAAGLIVPAMQRRPLRMMLLRGRLEPIYGHFVHGGRTRLTVTSAPGRSGDEIVWAIGGQLAEELATCEDEGVIHERAVAELLHAFPHLPLEQLELASYRATRAEASDPSHRRPSGFFLQAAASGVLVAWPTKLALAPLVADAVVAELASAPPTSASSAPCAGIEDWPHPSVAPYPWEEVEWRCAR